jgi:hypothetical protein
MEENTTENEVKRPGIGTVIGILSIIICSLGLLFGIIGMVGMIVANSLFGSIPVDMVQEAEVILSAVNTALTFGLIIAIVQLVLRAVGLTGGIGLLGNKRWAIVVSDIYAAGMILLLIVNFFLMKEVVNRIFQDPAIMAELQNEDVPIQFVKRVITGFSGAFSIIIGSIYPVLVLALINLPKVRKFYSSQDAPPVQEGE